MLHRYSLGEEVERLGFEAVAITYNPEYIRIKIITLDIQKAIVTYTWVCESN